MREEGAAEGEEESGAAEAPEGEEAASLIKFLIKFLIKLLIKFLTSRWESEEGDRLPPPP